jgi:hypothetical protein
VFFRVLVRDRFAADNDSRRCGGNAATAAGAKNNFKFLGRFPCSRTSRPSDSNSGERSFHHNSIAYPGRNNQKQLDDVSMSIDRNELAKWQQHADS